MTSTMTTVERIEKLFEDKCETNLGAVWNCGRKIAPIIAAEIDGLRRELSGARAETAKTVAADAHTIIDALRAALSEARVEAEIVRGNAADHEVRIDALKAEITALTERNAFLLTSAETAQAKLAEARAEVEKLTPLHEIWLAWETLATGPMTKDDTVAFIEKAHAIAEAAQTARETAKGQA